MKDSGFGSFLAGIAVGGLIGAAIGLLLAPASGEEMREQVNEFVDGRRAAFDEAVNEGRRRRRRHAPRCSAGTMPKPPARAEPRRRALPDPTRNHRSERFLESRW